MSINITNKLSIKYLHIFIYAGISKKHGANYFKINFSKSVYGNKKTMSSHDIILSFLIREIKILNLIYI
jgi:hypothetical protein